MPLQFVVPAASGAGHPARQLSAAVLLSVAIASLVSAAAPAPPDAAAAPGPDRDVLAQWAVAGSRVASAMQLPLEPLGDDSGHCAAAHPRCRYLAVPVPASPAAADGGGSPSHADRRAFGHDTPHSCGRFVIDGFATGAEIAAARRAADAAMAFGGGGRGGVTLVDLAAGVVTLGKRFAGLFPLMDRFASGAFDAAIRAGRLAGVTARPLPPARADVLVYRRLVRRIHAAVAMTFGIAGNDELPAAAQAPLGDGGDESEAAEAAAAGDSLRLAAPAFISRISAGGAQTVNDEYDHVHIDTQQYGAFDVTTLLYLSDREGDPEPWETAEAAAAAQRRRALDPSAEEAPDAPGDDEADAAGTDISGAGGDFTGGNFVFVDGAARDDAHEAALPVRPRRGRLLMFTSGAEHPHKVQRVATGVRYAMTTAFTCDKRGAGTAGGAAGERPDVTSPGFLGELVKRSAGDDEAGGAGIPPPPAVTEEL